MANDQHQRRLGFKNGTALAIGSVLGGAIGFAAYGFPLVATIAFSIGAPLLGISAGIKLLEVMLPKGELKDKIKAVTLRAFTAGVVITFLPMVAMGAVGYLATQKVLDTVIPTKAPKAEKTAPAAVETADEALSKRSLKSAFAAARARTARLFKAAPTPQPQAPQPPQP